MVEKNLRYMLTIKFSNLDNPTEIYLGEFSNLSDALEFVKDLEHVFWIHGKLDIIREIIITPVEV